MNRRPSQKDPRGYFFLAPHDTWTRLLRGGPRLPNAPTHPLRGGEEEEKRRRWPHTSAPGCGNKSRIGSVTSYLTTAPLVGGRRSTHTDEPPHRLPSTKQRADPRQAGASPPISSPLLDPLPVVSPDSVPSLSLSLSRSGHDLIGIRLASARSATGLPVWASLAGAVSGSRRYLLCRATVNFLSLGARD
jgi:hypothetical protein